jgi:PKD repeat protein
MRLPPLLAVFLLAAVAFAGCSGGDGDGGPTGTGSSTGTTTGSSTGTTTQANRPPQASLNVSVANGTSPLEVTFTVSGSDPDGDPLNWTLAFGDGNSTGGTGLPGNASHSYGSAGEFTALLTVSDGLANATANVTIAVAAGAVPDPLHFEGTLTGGPYIPFSGVTPNDLVDEATATHDFAFTGTPKTMTVTLAFEEGLAFNDVDLFITDPSGAETVSEEAGPEPPVEFADPAPGQWSVRVFAYGAEGEVPYTLDVAFA